MYQALLDVGAIVEVKTKNSPCLHIAISLSSTFQGHTSVLSAQLSASLKNQQLIKKMHVMCNRKWKSPNARLPRYSGLNTNC